jgi:hypothetical protein
MVKTPLDDGIRDHVPVGFFAAGWAEYRRRGNACQGRRREEIFYGNHDGSLVYSPPVPKILEKGGACALFSQEVWGAVPQFPIARREG